MSETPLARRSSVPAEASAESLAGVAPLTTKLAPGRVWNTAASVGALTQSCAQASRARSVSTAWGLTASRRSKRARFREPQDREERLRAVGIPHDDGQMVEMLHHLRSLPRGGSETTASAR